MASGIRGQWFEDEALVATLELGDGVEADRGLDPHPEAVEATVHDPPRAAAGDHLSVDRAHERIVEEQRRQAGIGVHLLRIGYKIRG